MRPEPLDSSIDGAQRWAPPTPTPRLRSGHPLRVAIAGSGFAGLSAATRLSMMHGVEVTIFESAAVPGGRANVTAEGEHCPRFFLLDYKILRALLAQVRLSSGRTLWEDLLPVRRMAWIPGRGWREISHLYTLLADEVSLRDLVAIWRAHRASPLIADSVANTNRYGSLRNYSWRSLLRMIANVHASSSALTVDGPTDAGFIQPWIDHLAARGVELHLGSAVQAIRTGDAGPALSIHGEWQDFDAVVITAFAPDAAELLEASNLDHGIPNLQHTHCLCLTALVDPREAALRGDGPRFYCRDGINVMVQPHHARCVALCTRSQSTDPQFVVTKLREILGLKHTVLDVRSRPNLEPREAVWAADYVEPSAVLLSPHPSIYFAGSWLSNDYPVDSAEGAARTAAQAVDQLARDHDLVPRKAYSYA